MDGNKRDSNLFKLEMNTTASTVTPEILPSSSPPAPFNNPNEIPLIDGNSELPPLKFQHSDYVLQLSNLPSGSKMAQYKMKRRSNKRHGPLGCYDKTTAGSNERNLRMAVNTGNIELLTKILEAGADPNAADDRKRTALHLAASRGRLRMVEQLLRFGANPNNVDSQDNTPLHLAVNSESSRNTNEVLRTLLHAGAIVNKCNRDGMTALGLAKEKLPLLGLVRGSPTPDSLEVFEEICEIISLLSRYFVKQQRELDDMSELERRTRNLGTSESQKQDVPVGFDELLAFSNRPLNEETIE